MTSTRNFFPLAPLPPPGPPLTASTPATQNLTIGTAYSLTLLSNGGTGLPVWTASGLPAGMAIAGSIISGTPTTAQTVTVMATVTDQSLPVHQTKTVSFVATVTAAVVPNTPPTQTLTVGTAFSLTLTATGGISPYTWVATNLPAGLVCSSAGVISGTPTTVQTQTVTVTATDNTGTRHGTATFTAAVTAAAGGTVSTFQVNPVATGTLPASPVIDPNSASIMSQLLASGNPLALQLIAYSEPLYYVHGNSMTKYPVTTDITGSAPNSMTEGGVPIPTTNFFAANGSDGQATIIDLDTGLAYCASVWNFNGSSATIYWGDVYTLNGSGAYGGLASGANGNEPDLSGGPSSPFPITNKAITWPGKPAGWVNPATMGNQTGAGTARFGFLITQADLAAAIANPMTAPTHALSFSCTHTAGPTYRFPATTTDGPQGNAFMPEGGKIWLPTSFDIATAMAGASPGAIWIARCIQNHGLICTDTGGSMVGMPCEFAGTYSSGNGSGVNSQTKTAFGSSSVGDYWNAPELWSSGAWAAMELLENCYGTAGSLV